MYRFTCRWGAALLLAMTACSSGAPRATPPPGALSPGTIDVTINGRSADSLRHAACTRVSSFTTVAAREGDSTVRAVLNDAVGIKTVSVEITNVRGFTGSYQQNLQGDAEARVTGSTFQISGVADGYNSERPASEATGDFLIKFAC
jgi:ipoprotein LpqH